MLHVVVVGGGPAGLIAAAILARAGVETTVLERRPDAPSPCAGVLSPAALALLDVPDLLLAQRVRELAIFSPTSRVAFVPLLDGERACGVMRRDLLQAHLRRRAEEAGARLVHATFHRFVHSVGDYPLLEISRAGSAERETLQADIVIGADGVHSRVARALELPPPELGVAYMEKLALPAPSGGLPSAPQGMQLHLGRKVSPDRYGWLVPHLDHLVVGVATHTRYGKRVWDMLAEVKRRLGSQIDGAKPAGRSSFVFPLTSRPRLAFERVLLVGEAAGLGAGITMDGLYYAAASGKLAAETVLANRNLPTPERLADYEAAWRAAHGPAQAGLARFEQLMFLNDRRREALVELAWDRQAQKEAIDAFMEKKPFAPPFRLALKLKTKLAATLVKYAVAGPRRPDGDPIGRALPAGENYLDFALRPEPATLTTLPPLREMLGEDAPLVATRDDG